MPVILPHLPTPPTTTCSCPGGSRPFHQERVGLRALVYRRRRVARGLPVASGLGTHTRASGEVPVTVARFLVPRSEVILCVPQPARWLGRLGSHFPLRRGFMVPCVTPLRRRPRCLVSAVLVYLPTPSPSLFAKESRPTLPYGIALSLRCPSFPGDALRRATPPPRWPLHRRPSAEGLCIGPNGAHLPAKSRQTSPEAH